MSSQPPASATSFAGKCFLSVAHFRRVEFDGTAAYEALKASRCLPDEPGRIEVDGLVVELGRHVRIW